MFIKVNEEYAVELVHYCPFSEEHGLHKTEEELLQEGYLVESIPEPEIIDGKAPVMKFDVALNEVYYEYVDIPPQPKTVEQLEQEVNNLTMMVADLIGGAI